MARRVSKRKALRAAEYRRLAAFAGIDEAEFPSPDNQREISTLAHRRAGECLNATIKGGGDVRDALAVIYVRAVADVVAAQRDRVATPNESNLEPGGGERTH